VGRDEDSYEGLEEMMPASAIGLPSAVEDVLTASGMSADDGDFIRLIAPPIDPHD